MGGPVTHNASMESVRIPLSPERRMDPHEPVKIEKDPLLSFEFFHYEMKADLAGWMTFTEEDRKRRAALFSSTILADVKPLFGRDEYRWTPARRNKVLNYIIWIESTHQKGSREVARLCFNALFPKKGDKE